MTARIYGSGVTPAGIGCGSRQRGVLNAGSSSTVAPILAVGQKNATASDAETLDRGTV